MQVVIPGDFIWLLEQKTQVKCIKSGIVGKLANLNPYIPNAKDMSKGVEKIQTIVYAS